MDPVFAFDREVIPFGTIARGQVSSVHPVNKWLRVRAIVNGDFTPLRNAQIEFTTLILPDGRELAVSTLDAEALNSIYAEPSKKKIKPHSKTQSQSNPQPQDQNGGILGIAKKSAKDQLNGAISARTHGIADIVRSPNKKERLVDFCWSKLPYHPQYLRRGTRIDAPLRNALPFGTAEIPPGELVSLGSQPPPDSVARVRLLTSLDSGTSKTSEPVEAVLAAPVFSAGGQLALPEGTRLTGAVVVAKRARFFHRSGQLRFNFHSVDLPEEAAKLAPSEPTAQSLKTDAILEGAEGSGTAPIRVDAEGGVAAQESKTRFLAPAISLILASRSADNDAGRHATNGTGVSEPNISGRTLGGGLGLGMVGSAVAQSSKYVGMAFGYYGLAWSVYLNVVARGSDVHFSKNAMMDIRFGSRPTSTSARSSSHLQSTTHQ